jgi:hypothetical protein
MNAFLRLSLSALALLSLPCLAEASKPLVFAQEIPIVIECDPLQEAFGGFLRLEKRADDWRIDRDLSYPPYTEDGGSASLKIMSESRIVLEIGSKSFLNPSFQLTYHFSYEKDPNVNARNFVESLRADRAQANRTHFTGFHFAFSSRSAGYPIFLVTEDIFEFSSGRIYYKDSKAENRSCYFVREASVPAPTPSMQTLSELPAPKAN